jgi:hypothetical protein
MMTRVPAPTVRSVRSIPFDHAFPVFDLMRTAPGRAVRRVLTVSAEGSFIATALGHGFVMAPDDTRAAVHALADPLTPPPPPQTSYLPFLYRLRDEGSGRELQNDPILSTAGLGSADGDRPFRPFARPVVFAPRTVVSLEVVPLVGISGQLHVCLHGFKVLGGSMADAEAQAALVIGGGV